MAFVNAPLKKKSIRGKKVPFINKKLRKEMYKPSTLRNELCRNPTKEIELVFK